MPQSEDYYPLYDHFRRILDTGLKIEAYDVLHALFKAEQHIKRLEEKESVIHEVTPLYCRSEEATEVWSRPEVSADPLGR